MNAWRSGEMLEVPMSEQLARAYEGFRAAGTAPAVPRLAATVMLVRSPREVFMLRRAATMAFVPEAVVFPGGGGFALTFPVAAGDECLVVFASRCIDAWWQSGGVGEPMEPRMHDLSDGFALVGVRSQPHRLSPAVHTGNTQLRADDGSAYVEITPGGAVTAVGPSSVTVRSGGSITLDAPRIVIKGLLSMQSQGGGATTATLAGSLNATGDVTASNISLNSHTHPGDSGGTTGGPQ